MKGGKSSAILFSHIVQYHALKTGIVRKRVIVYGIEFDIHFNMLRSKVLNFQLV